MSGIIEHKGLSIPSMACGSIRQRCRRIPAHRGRVDRHRASIGRRIWLLTIISPRLASSPLAQETHTRHVAAGSRNEAGDLDRTTFRPRCGDLISISLSILSTSHSSLAKGRWEVSRYDAISMDARELQPVSVWGLSFDPYHQTKWLKADICTVKHPIDPKDELQIL